MISAIIARGIGFGGVNFIPTHGFSAAAVVVPEPGIGTTVITAYGGSTVITQHGGSTAITSHGGSTVIEGDT